MPANCLTAKNSVYSLTARTEGCDSSDKGSIPFRQTMGAKRNGIAARPEPVCPIRVGGSYPSSARHFLRLAESAYAAALNPAFSGFDPQVEDHSPLAELVHALGSNPGDSRFKSGVGYHRRLGKLVNLPALEAGFSRFESEISDQCVFILTGRDLVSKTSSGGSNPSRRAIDLSSSGSGSPPVTGRTPVQIRLGLPFFSHIFQKCHRDQRYRNPPRSIHI